MTNCNDRNTFAFYQWRNGKVKITDSVTANRAENCSVYECLKGCSHRRSSSTSATSHCLYFLFHVWKYYDWNIDQARIITWFSTIYAHIHHINVPERSHYCKTFSNVYICINWLFSHIIHLWAGLKLEDFRALKNVDQFCTYILQNC